MKTLALFVAAAAMGGVLPRCCFAQAQNVTEVAYLSTDETAQARESAGKLRAAGERDRRAKAAWQGFLASWHAAHPGSGELRFSSDMRYAFSRDVSPARDPYAPPIITTELTASEQTEAQRLYSETREAAAALTQAAQAHHDFSRSLAARYFKSWTGGLYFVSDYRVALPAF